VADIFRQAARANLDDPRRRGSTLWIEGDHRVVIAGDIHGHRANLAKTLSFADLDATSPSVLVLQEIIHGPPDPRTGQDRSFDMVLRAARLKNSYPRQLVLLLGNHDVAQVSGNEITKEGRGVCREFAKALSADYGEDGGEILEAVCEFCLSMPLAVRFSNGVLATHSLPSPRRTELAGVEIFDRPITPDDLRRGQPVYEWTWGRKQTPEQVEQLAEKLGVSMFVLGHQYLPEGYDFIGERAVILASDHERGHLLEFYTNAPLTADQAREGLRRITSL
jgi:hypothetical protein